MAIQPDREAWMKQRLAIDVARGNVKATPNVKAFLAGEPMKPNPTRPDTWEQLSQKLSERLSKQINKSIADKYKEEAKRLGLKREVRQHGRDLVADCTGSTCFDALYYSDDDGGVIASFINPTAGDWLIPCTRDEAREWFESVSLGETFNAEFR